LLLSRSTRKFLLLLALSWFFFAGTGGRAFGQQPGSIRQQPISIHGTVYNMYRTKPLDAVSVVSTSGRGTTTDSNGNYIIMVQPEDSIYFSYLGRLTAKFPVRTMNYSAAFDVALHVDPTELKEVKVMPRNYHMDSLQNRKDYAKIFDFKKPGFKLSDGTTGVGLGAGIDLDELINVFRFQRTHRLLAFQRRLVDEEQDKFIDHRFAPSVVLKITHLTGDELDSFMVRYRPSYEFCKRSNDYDFYDYIKLAFREYQKDRKERP
jgi:hypothetical protein